jgi:uncharacterized membrane protein YraQ (UPF0718 family)
MLLLIHNFLQYLIEVLPALLIGFVISGIINQFTPKNIIEKYFSGKGIKPIFYLTFLGAILPICCCGALPLAVTMHKKGIRLGPVLAFLVAAPATSITALLVAYRVLGLKIAVFQFFSVIILGLIIGIIGNFIKYKPKESEESDICPDCNQQEANCNCHKGAKNVIKSILKYSFIEMPREIGLMTVIGLLIAAIVATITPIGDFIRSFLNGGFSYLFALVFGITTNFCATSIPPVVDALVRQGMNLGAGMTLLLISPITSYSMILVLSKKFGLKVVATYLAVISITCILMGLLFTLFR